MNDNRLEQVYNMVTELVRIVGNTNAAVEELRADVAVLKNDVAELKSDVAVLKNDVAELKSDVAVLKNDVAELKTDVAILKTGQKRLEKNQEILLQNQQTLKEEIDNFRGETEQTFHSINTDIEYLAGKIIKHDMRLYELKKRSNP